MGRDVDVLDTEMVGVERRNVLRERKRKIVNMAAAMGGRAGGLGALAARTGGRNQVHQKFYKCKCSKSSVCQEKGRRAGKWLWRRNAWGNVRKKKRKGQPSRRQSGRHPQTRAGVRLGTSGRGGARP